MAVAYTLTPRVRHRLNMSFIRRRISFAPPDAPFFSNLVIPIPPNTTAGTPVIIAPLPSGGRSPISILAAPDPLIHSDGKGAIASESTRVTPTVDY